MSGENLREQLERDQSWRIDEVRQLRNTLLGDLKQEDWPAHSLRALLVMQYAHLEGYTQTAFRLYVDEINSAALKASELKQSLVVAGMAKEFKAFRDGSDGVGMNGGEGFLLRRARRQSAFVDKLRLAEREAVLINAEEAVSLEMNLGADVLRRNLFVLAVPEEELEHWVYGALEFFRKNRNDISHGVRTEKIPPSLFRDHYEKFERYMGGLGMLLYRAVREGWYRA